jgi:primary-amine oxidase
VVTLLTVLGGPGLLTGACTNPIWVVKTRMLERGANHPSAYKSMSFGLRHVYETRGLKGLWAGFIPSSLGVLHGAVQFSIYENMKKRRGSQVGGQDRLSNWEYVYMSGGSKLLAGAITYPYQPIRARMQQYDAAQQYTGLVDVLRKTYRNEGFLAFYKGYALRRIARRLTHHPLLGVLIFLLVESFLIPYESSQLP